MIVLPEQNEEQTFQMLLSSIKEDPKKAVKNVWKGIVPERWLLFLFQRAGIQESEDGQNLAHEKIRALHI